MTKFHFSDEQNTVINTPAPRVYVPAHAGAGKTSTLCARIRRLLDRAVLPEQILAVSFSNKACNLILDRLRNGVPVQTFHAFGYHLIRAGTANNSGLKLVTPKASVKLLRLALKEYQDTCDQIHQKTGIGLRTLIGRKHLTSFFDRTHGSDEVMARLATDPNSGFKAYLPVLEELRLIRSAYDELLAAQGDIDYPGMLSRACELVPTAKLPYRYLFVDECQDMNAAQADLLVELAKRIPNVMVFGDPRQAVFGFMGSQHRDIPALLDGAVTLPLTKSFRLTHQTAATANAILRLDGQQPVIGNNHGSKPTLAKCVSAKVQENMLIRLIEGFKEARIPGSQIVILGRTKLQLRDAEQALRAAGYETSALYQPRMPEHTDRLLDLLDFIEQCAISAAKGNRPNRTWRANRLSTITGVTVEKPVMYDCLRKLLIAARVKSFDGRYIAATRIYLRMMRTTGEKATPIAIELGRWEAISRKFKTVPAFRAHIDFLRRQDPIVTSTIHGAKGGEWDHVIVLGVTEGSIPFFREMERGELDEERRLLYVAVTRARKQVHLFHAPFHHANSRQSFTDPSCFLTDEVKGTLRPQRIV